jgi:anti-sigma factor RsiW
MIVDEQMLRAYVDGELDPTLREQVDAVLTHSPELRTQADALRASCLPYRAAFEAQALPAPPASLLRYVTGLSAVAAASPSIKRATPAHAHAQVLGRRRAWGVGLAMAASFAAGLVVPLRWATGSADETPWVSAIASYHALYVRETVGAQADPPARIQSLLAGFSEQQKAQIFVPDLQAAGLAFKRVQRLGYGALPLIQMVYLPANGRPAALCLLPTQRPEAAVAVQQIEGQSVATWVHQGLAYVLVGDIAPQELLALAHRVAEGKFPKA